jgi:quercetin dioxygenase-like cupin family protein
MKEMNITSNISNGIIHFSNQSIDISEIEWKNHPDYKGVSLKHMITGEKTGGLFSSHLIKLDPNSCIETHCHENQTELHEVIEGNGSFHLLKEVVDYHLGKMAVIPKGKNHMVRAGENGLTLLAKFFPALL